MHPSSGVALLSLQRDFPPAQRPTALQIILLPSPNFKTLPVRDLGYGVRNREWAVAELQAAMREF